MKKGKFIVAGLVSLALVVALVPLFSGCPPPRPVEKYVIWLSLADYTGPIAGLNVPADMGSEDYAKFVNERGGVDGVMIKFIGVDTRYDVARAISAYKRYRMEPKLFVVNSISTGGAKALAPFYEKDKVVAMTAGGGEFVAKPGRIFLWGPAYQNAFAAAMDWMVKDWRDKGKPGMPVIGYISWDNPYGREHLMGGKEYAEKIGVTLLPPELFPAGALKHDIYLTRLAGAGANYIYVGGVDPTPTNILRDAHALGLTKTIQFVTDYWGPREDTGIKAHPEACEGAVINYYGFMGEELRKNPRAGLWTKYRGRPLEEMHEAYVGGQSWVINFEEALRRALREVSYEELTGDHIFKAYKGMTGFHPENPVTAAPLTYSETERQGSKHTFMHKVINRKLVRITPEPLPVPDAAGLYKW